MGGPPGRNFSRWVPVYNELSALEIRVSRRAREGDHVTDIFQTGEIHHHALQAKAEAGVGDGAVPAQVEIPPISFFI